MSGCKAQRVNDEMHCGACGLQWPVDDIDPPDCLPARPDRQGVQRPARGGWAPCAYSRPASPEDPLAAARRLLDDET